MKSSAPKEINTLVQKHRNIKVESGAALDTTFNESRGHFAIPGRRRKPDGMTKYGAMAS